MKKQKNVSPATENVVVVTFRFFQVGETICSITLISISKTFQACCGAAINFWKWEKGQCEQKMPVALPGLMREQELINVQVSQPPTDIFLDHLDQGPPDMEWYISVLIVAGHFLMIFMCISLVAQPE